MAFESFQVHLCSSDADIINNNNTADCVFNMPIIEIDSQNHIYLSVVHATIPYTFYQINSSNNYLVYSYNGIKNDLTITEGNYNVYNLATYLQTNLPNTTVSYSSITNAFTFTCTSNVNFAFYLESTCLPLLGFASGSNPLSFYASSNYILTSTQAVNLITTNCLCIYSNLKTYSFNKSKVNDQSVLCSIPINVAPCGMIIHSNHDNYKCNTFTNVISQIEIKICDQEGNIINLNGSNWTITLQFDILNYT